MANTTFSGPVRSQNGFEVISVNSSTGAVTTTATLGTATNVTTLTATGNITADSTQAVVAGGAAAFLATTTANLGIFVGSGAPTVSAAQGSLYIRTDGSSTSTRLYVNTNGSTTWTNVTTAA
jgi:hypothetical protein